ncbi:MAG: SRPBCC family protein [Actinobacteria bacterium]|jgi:hypothetical protein|uniref:Unannotated protein n=1 Tax=freshwater metagenome TaxID=449393 RepID=A0A6J7LP95_9ZZZZ|nr:SRPBCC family protein [Actinomycetota bacterium]MSV64691.1 SRPBCC family protein [Actinomycetota bacterium]MSX49296.1 SRPBCC family protein [Actinomycetota bacterium]MSX69315.1 SRPBCC family protein [Actinomycetota bacterium]MSY15356.1 SRPBCC family protein [Actinomycetota bacterium]
MPPINQLALTVEIKQPIKVVWKHLVDWQGQSKWMLQTKVWSELDQDKTVKNGKGVLIFAFTGLFAKFYPKLKFGVLDTMEVVNWQPPKRCDVVHIGRIIRGTGKFELVSKKNSTIFYWSEEIIAPAIFLAIIKPFLLVGVRISLRRFARLVERSGG